MVCSIISIDNNITDNIRKGINVLLRKMYCKDILSRTTPNCLILKNDEKQGQISDLKFLETWVCGEDQHATPPDLLKVLAILSDTTVRRSAFDQEDLEPYWKEATFAEVINNPAIDKFFKDFTSHRKKTNRAVVFSQRPLPSILKYKEHRWNLPTIWKTRLFETHIEQPS